MKKVPVLAFPGVSLPFNTPKPSLMLSGRLYVANFAKPPTCIPQV
jgi:hypothetical protein